MKRVRNIFYFASTSAHTTITLRIGAVKFKYTSFNSLALFALAFIANREKSHKRPFSRCNAWKIILCLQFFHKCSLKSSSSSICDLRARVKSIFSLSKLRYELNSIELKSSPLACEGVTDNLEIYCYKSLFFRHVSWCGMYTQVLNSIAGAQKALHKNIIAITNKNLLKSLKKNTNAAWNLMMC